MKKLNALILSALFVLAFLVVAPQAYAEDATKQKTQYYEGNAGWPGIPNAQKIQIYYKEKGASNWQHSVRDLNGMSTNVMLRHLQPGKKYVYRVLARKRDGSWWWSPEYDLKTWQMP